MKLGRSRLWRRIALLALAGYLVIDDQVRADSQDWVEVKSVVIYSALDIETGKDMGQFFQVHGEIQLSSETVDQINQIMNAPLELTAKLRIGSVEFPSCGTVGLATVLSDSSEEREIAKSKESYGVFSISPIFFVPRSNIEVTSSMELTIGLGRDYFIEKASITITKNHLPSIVDDATLSLLDERVTNQPNYKSLDGEYQQVQAVQVRLQLGFLHIFGWDAQLVCGDQVADWLRVSHDSSGPITAFFVRPVRPTRDTWEVRFPKLGVKLRLEVAGQ